MIPLKPKGSFGTGLLIGFGASTLLPLAARMVAGAGRPLLKESIKGGLMVMDRGRALYAQTRGSLNKADHEAETESSSKRKTKS